MRMRLEDWTIDLNDKALQDARWMGVHASKNPLDAWIYQEIIWETRPDVVVELGSADGGGALFLAHMLELLGGDRIVISVDVSRDTFAAEHERIVEVTGLTTDPDVIRRVTELCDRRRAMVIHDASHREKNVLADLRTYGPLVSPGCYLVVEDGIADWLPVRKLPGSDPGPGPYPAIQAYVAENPAFELDRDRERFRMTNNPSGFLRKRDA